MKTYVQYEIAEGAYDIACPDAQCPREGVLTIIDIENLVLPDIVHKHQKYRLNRGIISFDFRRLKVIGDLFIWRGNQ